MHSGVALTLLGLSSVAVQGVAANVWRAQSPYNCPTNIDNQCTDAEHQGFDWQDLPEGPVDQYKDYNFSGWKCGNKPVKRGLEARDFNSRCISTDASEDDFSNEISCEKQFSVGHMDVSADKDTDVEFHYGMPDGSTCKKVASCGPTGATIPNDQCGGAKTVKVKLPKGNGSSKCEVNIHSVKFECNTSTTKLPVPTTTLPPHPQYPQPTTTSCALPEKCNGKPYGKGCQLPAYCSQGTAPYPAPSGTAPAHSYPAPSGSSPPHSYPAPSGSAPSHSYPAPSGTAPPHSYPVPSGTAPGHSYPAPTYPAGGCVLPPKCKYNRNGKGCQLPASCSHGPTHSYPTHGHPSPSYPAHSQPSHSYPPHSYPASSGTKPAHTYPSMGSSGSPPASGYPSSSSVLAHSSYPSASGYPAPSGGSSSSSPHPPAIPPPSCPATLPKCLNTWLFTTTCTDNANPSCYCSHNPFVKKVTDCLSAWSDDDSSAAKSLEYFMSLCQPYNAITPPAAIPIPSIQPGGPNIPVQTLTRTATELVPCPTSGTMTTPTTSTRTVVATYTIPKVTLVVTGTEASLVYPSTVAATYTPAPAPPSYGNGTSNSSIPAPNKPSAVPTLPPVAHGNGGSGLSPVLAGVIAAVVAAGMAALL